MVNELASEMASMDSKILVAIIAGSVALLLSIISTVMTTYQYFHSKKLEKNKEKREIIMQRLNDFYAPLLSYLNLSKSLYLIFKSDKPQELRLVTYLLNPHQEYSEGKVVSLTESDRELIHEIIAISEKIKNLILEKPGLIDDIELSYNYSDQLKFNLSDSEIEKLGLFTILLMHFRVVKMAFEGKFDSDDYDKTILNNFVYPRELNKIIIDKITKLQNDLVNHE